MNRLTRLVLIGSVILGACGGGGPTGNGATEPPTGPGDDGASGPTVARQFEGEAYPGERTLLGGFARQSVNGCWSLSSPEDDSSMIIWPKNAVQTDDGLGITLSGAEVRSGSIIQGMATRVPVARLTGIVDGFWANVTDFCEEDEAVTVLDDVVVLANADTSFDLSDSYPCGIGFTAATPEQHVALILHVRDASEPDLSGHVSFPDDNWNGELLIGHDLMANWCNDAIEEGAPMPIVHVRLPVIAGTLTFAGPIPDGSRCEPNPVTGTTSGIVIEWVGGAQVPMQDLTITNEAFGCFAG